MSGSAWVNTFRASDFNPIRCEHALLRRCHDGGVVILVRHVPVASIGARLREDEPEFANESRREAAGLDEREEDADRSPDVSSGHERRWVELREVLEVLCGELL